jgi:hypothetical protein
MADALVSNTSGRKAVWVRLPPLVPSGMVELVDTLVLNTSERKLVQVRCLLPLPLSEW